MTTTTTEQQYALFICTHKGCHPTDCIGDRATIERYMYWNRIADEGLGKQEWWDIKPVPEDEVEGWDLQFQCQTDRGMQRLSPTYKKPPTGPLVDTLFNFAPREQPGPITGVMVSDILRAIRRLKEAQGRGYYLVVAKPGSLAMMWFAEVTEEEAANAQQVYDIHNHYEYYQYLITNDGHASVAFIELTFPKALQGAFCVLSAEAGVRMLQIQKDALPPKPVISHERYVIQFTDLGYAERVSDKAAEMGLLDKLDKVFTKCVAKGNNYVWYKVVLTPFCSNDQMSFGFCCQYKTSADGEWERVPCQTGAIVFDGSDWSFNT